MHDLPVKTTGLKPLQTVVSHSVKGFKSYFSGSTAVVLCVVVLFIHLFYYQDLSVVDLKK